MLKLLLVTLCVLLLSVETAFCADTPPFTQPGALFKVKFSTNYFTVHSSMNTDGDYVIKIDAISKTNPNWVLVEFPQDSNISYTSTLAGQRWLNLNYVVELTSYTAPAAPAPAQ